MGQCATCGHIPITARENGSIDVSSTTEQRAVHHRSFHDNAQQLKDVYYLKEYLNNTAFPSSGCNVADCKLKTTERHYHCRVEGCVKGFAQRFSGENHGRCTHGLKLPEPVMSDMFSTKKP